MAADVHLGKGARDEPARWQGQRLGEVVDATEVERVILLRAVTSAPASLDLANIRRMLVENAGAVMRVDGDPAPPWRVRDGIWHALLLMRDDSVFELEVMADGAVHRGCLRAGDGGRGCFDLAGQGLPGR